MQVDWIYYFLTVARYENISIAAVEHGISQPAMSHAIRKLERELNIQLFERKGNRLFLNEKGKAFRESATKSMDLLNHGIMTITEDRTNPRGEISVLLLSNREMATNRISKFMIKYPNVTFKVSQGMFGSSVFDADVCFATVPPNQKLNTKIALLEEVYVLAVSSAHILGKKAEVKREDLEHEKFIIMPLPSNQNIATAKICKSFNFNPVICAVCDSPYTVCQLIHDQAGIAFIPSKTWEFAREFGINFIPLGSHTAFRTVYIWWNSNKYMSLAVRMFIESFNAKIPNQEDMNP